MARPAASSTTGLALAAVGFMLLPFGDAIGKHLAAEGFHALQIAWGRWVSHTVIITPIVLLLFGARCFRFEQPGLHLLRGGALIVATVFFFTALKYVPLANATAMLFVAPLLATALAAIMLGERVGPRRWGAVFAGLIGVLMIVKPATDGFEPESVYALGAAFCFAFYIVISRKMAGRTPPLVALWWMGMLGTAAMSATVAPVWVAPTNEHFLWMMGIGVAMAAGHFLVISAVDRVEASALAVTPYLEMITATALGLLVFGDFPDMWTWLGCAVVVAAGCFVAWRERVLQRRIVTSGVP